MGGIEPPAFILSRREIGFLLLRDVTPRKGGLRYCLFVFSLFLCSKGVVNYKISIILLIILDKLLKVNVSKSLKQRLTSGVNNLIMDTFYYERSHAIVIPAITTIRCNVSYRYRVLVMEYFNHRIINVRVIVRNIRYFRI